MSTDEIKQALSGLAPESPPWLAILAMLEETVRQEVEGVAATALTDSARHFNAGRVALALDVRDAFGSIMDEINKERQM